MMLLTKRVLRIVPMLTLLIVGTRPALTGAASVEGAQTSCPTFPATGKPVCGRFLTYWREHGGLAQQGYPLSGEIAEINDTDSKVYTVQYFERAVFEYHPENAGTSYEVLLSLLGVDEYTRRYGQAGTPPQPANSQNPRFFPQTGKTIGGKFREYWERNGGRPSKATRLPMSFRRRVPSTGNATLYSTLSGPCSNGIRRTPRPLMSY